MCVKPYLLLLNLDKMFAIKIKLLVKLNNVHLINGQRSTHMQIRT